MIGGKTGYTEAAGYCYVTAARFDDREVVMAFYGAEGKLTRFADFNRVAAWIDRGAPGAKVEGQARQARRAPEARRRRARQRRQRRVDSR